MRETMTIKCECGGSMRRARLKEFDFSALAGLPVIVRDLPGLRCARCGAETLSGQVIDELLERVALELVRQEPRLRSEQARFLRKRLGLTQHELAARMALNRQTVAKWETEREAISPQNDMALRALVLGKHGPGETAAGAVWDHP